MVRLFKSSNAPDYFPWIHKRPYTKHLGRKTQLTSVTSAQSKPYPHPSMTSAEGGGNSVVSLTFGYLFTVLCSFLKLLVQLKGCPGLSKSRLWLVLFGEAMWEWEGTYMKQSWRLFRILSPEEPSFSCLCSMAIPMKTLILGSATQYVSTANETTNFILW